MPRSLVTIAAENSNSAYGKAVLVFIVGAMLLGGLAGIFGVCFYWPWMRNRWGWWLHWKTFFGNRFPMSRLGTFAMFFFILNLGLPPLISHELRDHHNVILILALLFFFGMWVKDYLDRSDDEEV